MVNAKKIGSEFERKICEIINKILGSDFKRTEMSGGGKLSVDIWDYSKKTPLSRRSIEVKKHGSLREFRKKIVDDIEQAIRQQISGTSWLLVTKYPESGRILVVQDLEDYLIMDVLSQMVCNDKELKKLIKDIEDGIYKVKDRVAILKSKL